MLDPDDDWPERTAGVDLVRSDATVLRDWAAASSNSHADADMCWWDAGTLNSLIKSDDLRMGHVERTRTLLATS